MAKSTLSEKKDTQAETGPRTFISYSWSSPSHESWVLNLATQLREDGVDIVLDKWDLREGHDAIAFMEMMVTDPTVRKVIVVSDRGYAEKADGRKGGVGTETQIISGELYGKTNQDKFCAVLSELDAAGKPFLPTYYKSRIFIDLSSEEIYAANYEQLLRWLFDRSVHPKPSLGRPPAFITEKDAPALPIGSNFRRATDALRQNLASSLPFLEDYLDSVSSNFEMLRIQKSDQVAYDDQVVQSIDTFLPYRNQLIEIFKLTARHNLEEPYILAIHRFFERLAPYMNQSQNARSWHSWEFDNFRFIIWELYLYAMAILLQSERFSAASTLINTQFYAENPSSNAEKMQHFGFLYEPTDSLENRNQRLKLNRISLRADILEQRSHTSGVDFARIMQADFVLFVRSAQLCLAAVNEYQRWWPATLVYMGRLSGPLEIFARAASKKYFDRLKLLFDVERKTDFEPLYTAFREERLHVPQFNYSRVDVSTLMNFSKLETQA
jgi:hypothetical protein